MTSDRHRCYNISMAKEEPKSKPPPEDPIQSALDAVERATGEQLAEDDGGEKQENPMQNDDAPDQQ
ncbi:MAG: hypothetical protein IH987_13780 [Planctomycetes bacterium]|nr:hypothetical protein [Planctomycetota bacterium]